METIKSWGREYTLYTFTGKVTGSSKNLETKVHGGGGGGFNYRGTGGSAPVTISSTTVIHDQIFLQDAEGGERALQLTDFNVACRETHVLTALWAIKNGKNEGPYIVIHNHTTAQTFYNDKVLGGMFRPPWYFLVGVCVLTFTTIIGPFIAMGIWFYLGKRDANKYKSTLNFSSQPLAADKKETLNIVAENNN